MNLKEIKQILEKEGKIVIVEKGKPTMVIMDFEGYSKKLRSRNSGNLASFSNLNQKKELPEELQKEELKIEDLPV